MAQPGLFAVALALAARQTSAAANSLFQVEIPASLKRPGGYPHAAALFGRPNYGSITQRMYYARLAGATKGEDQPDDLCTLNPADMPNYPTPFILMVDRGGCSFVTKARNAQALGASALVAADTRCVCGQPCEPQSSCQWSEPVLVDDGSGGDVTIPALMLQKQDADEIRDYLRCGKWGHNDCQYEDWSKDTVVQAALEYTVPAPDDRVEWELWTTAIDSASLDFLSAFKDTVLALGTRQQFSPMMYTYNGSAYGCDLAAAASSTIDLCGNLCTNDGKYCAPDPDGVQDEGISGADVVEEDLRRACLWRLVGGDDAPDATQRGVGETWFDYVGNFSKLCSTAEAFVDENCRLRAMQAAGVDAKKVDKCVADSGGLEKGRNTVLDETVKALKAKNIVYVPECIVNEVVHWGTLEPQNILGAICQGYPTNLRPKACDCVGIAGSAAYAACLAGGPASGGGGGGGGSGKHASGDGGGGMPWYGVLLLVVSIIVLMLLAGLAYWKHTQKQMRDQVRGILAEYMPLDDLGGGGGGGDPDRPAVFSVSQPSAAGVV